MPAATEQLTAAQLDEVEPLWAQLLAHHSALPRPPRMRPRPLEASWRERRARYAQGMADGTTALFVVRDEAGHPIGYAAVVLHNGERPLLRSETGQMGELDTIVVDEGSRGTGAGSALVRAAREWLRERDAAPMLIGVRAANADELEFYGRLGATPAFVSLALP
jgi:GNAT superfamily N-acetyltransferase